MNIPGSIYKDFVFRTLFEGRGRIFLRIYSDTLPMYTRLEGLNMPKLVGKYFFLGVWQKTLLKSECIQNSNIQIECYSMKVYFCEKK